MFILGALASLIFVSLTSWYRYQNEAIVMYWDHQYELFRLVKPSLLICPTNVLQESKFPATFKRYGIKDTPKARAFFHFLSNVSYANMIDTPDYDDASPELWLRILNDLKREFYYETTLSDTGIWVATENGLCVSLGNYVLPYASLKYLLASNWTVSPLPTYPPDSLNYQMSDTMIDDSKYIPSYTYDEDHGRTEFVRTDAEAMLSILDPMDSYTASNRYLLQILELQNVVLRIFQIDIAKGIDDLPIHRRKCGFPWDKGLKLWPIYSFEMCVTECRSRIIGKKCACSPHFLRRIPGVPVCNVKQLRCIGRIKESLEIGPPFCNCLQNCNKVAYITGQNRTTRLKEGSPINTTSFKMTVDFAKSKYKRTEWYTFGGFLTSVGGAAGLFLGCSVLSFVEILYYTTLHLYIYIRKNKQKKK
ncbi:hypothetical protein KPH14_010509 [Odynerus spinipes]|uniref:Uncharacterized protein n=1 Tax=Odynerus spinipes TaxID=1348599 RepID=A0AAD9RUN7_9HYME|nr:hypothetical protein KPH14_010509 [Odynerus spinipes]